jgi:hypothetical protein
LKRRRRTWRKMCLLSGLMCKEGAMLQTRQTPKMRMAEGRERKRSKKKMMRGRTNWGHTFLA